jgi:hemerythrin-like domain-containing protein
MADSPFDSSAPSFDDPIAMLRACHDRLERQLATLERLARHIPEHGCDASARGAARAILRYFDSAEPNHHADEEASIFPRLLAHTPSVRGLVARLAVEHDGMHSNWRRMRPLLAGIACGQRANLPPRLVHDMQRAYAAHLALEHESLLPVCEELLTAAELAEIGGEMAARRTSSAIQPKSRSSIARA